MNQSIFACRVCGYLAESAPWGEDGCTPLFEICNCCGVSYGYEDYTVESARKYRQRWIDQGALWHLQAIKPQSWDIEQQLSNIPAKFR